jgi:putative ABC transport system permease protein
MRGDKYFGLAFEALLLNKVRSTLTMVGIVIGVLSVIVLIGLGQAAQAYITQQVEGLGAGLLMIAPGNAKDQGGMGMGGALAAKTLTLSDVRALEDVPGVQSVAPMNVLMLVLKAGRTTVGGQVVGSTPWIGGMPGYEIARGRNFTEQESRTGARVIVLGHRLAEDLYRGGLTPALGQKVQVESLRLRVIGVLKPQGGLSDTDVTALMPLRTFQVGLRDTDKVDMVYLRAASEEALPAVKAQAERVLRQRHALRADEEDDFTIQSMAELMATVNVVTQGFTVLLAGIAAISLLVGGIGIMNIMLVSATERTREIGVRKALGAKRRDILAQFLIEALTLSLAGGAAGIVLGVGATWAVTRAAQLPFVASPWAIVGGFLFSAAVGIFFGLYPASRASKLEPVEALRYE